MATTITAGNATNGLALTPDNTGILQLKTGTGSGTTALTLDASQNATVAGTLTATNIAFASAQSLIRVNTVAKGSTNTAVLTWSTTAASNGSDITYTPSATNGATFTINTNGVYAFSGSAVFASSNSLVITLNSSQLTTNPASLTLSTVLASTTCASGGGNLTQVSWSGYLPSGSVIRFQTETTAGVSATLPTVASAARIG